MRYWVHAVACLALVAATAQAKPVIQPVPLRIMPIGDSITEGDAGGGYRLPLFQRITQAYGMPNFVGHRSSRHIDPPEFPDPDHDGYGAYRIDQITSGRSFWNAPPINERLAHWEPAVVTIHAGTNDAQQNYWFDGNPARGIAPVIDRLDDLVSRVVAHNPATHVFVAQIVPANAPASATTIDYVVRLNALIPGLVARHQAAGHRVHLVDLYTPMLAFPHPDGIHPSPQGYAEMARVWFEAMAAVGLKPHNPNPGRVWRVQQQELWTTRRHTPWRPQDNLIRQGNPALKSMRTLNYRGDSDPALLNDGAQNAWADDADNTWQSRYELDTQAQPAGWDVMEIRTTGGRPLAPNGDERAHQAYEVWWVSVDQPTLWQPLGAFHHIMVNRRQTGSQLLLRRADGQPLMRGVAAIQFRFVAPPRRQFGFIGIASPTPYRELEVFGQPSRR